MHIFDTPLVRNKGNDAPRAVGCQGETCLFLYLTQHTFFRHFPRFKLAADTDPLVMVQVVFLFYPVQHQVTVIFFDITKCG